MFSSRVPSSLDSNALSRAVRAAKATGRPLIDLTATNPTTAGFEYPDGLLAPLNDPAAFVYEPAPFGLRRAREAVVGDYSRRGIAIPADRIILTAGTSEAYSFLFKLLCSSGEDAVLTPAPSYPLFEHLTRLDGVSPIPYALEYQGYWTLDLDSIDAMWTPRVRAILAVSPNNPTGSMLSARELQQLSIRCAERDAALIVDEVFADYTLGGGSGPTLPNDAPSCLTFRLGGLSKSAGLPQVKLGWIAVEGPDSQVAAALDQLEFICDAYLSVSTPIQVALPALIAEGAHIRLQIARRVRSNYDRLLELGSSCPSVDVLSADAGWSAVLRVPSKGGEERLVLDLLERDAVVVYPGFFFDFPHEAFLVVSLLPPTSEFEAGVRRVLDRVG